VATLEGGGSARHPGRCRAAPGTKLAIRGQTAIEGAIDAAIAEALHRDVPPELRPESLRFQTRLALAVALRIISVAFKGMFAELARLRNDFAHGKIATLTPGRANRLVASLGPFLDDDPQLAELKPKLAARDPVFVLRTTLAICRSMVGASRRVHERRRKEDERILAAARAGGGLRGSLIANLRHDEPPTPTT
jgi:hypothetical protein